MDDLISRQAAIASAISGRVRTLPTSEDGEDWIRTSEVRESLLSLPSAQPKIIRCKDCKHFHENVWGNEIGLDDWPIIVAHEACDAWGEEWTQSCVDGYCHMAERRNDE